jgi:hypothetical protein
MSRGAASAPARPSEALEHLAAHLRAEGSVLSDHVVEPEEEPFLGLLAAAGPRAREAPPAYALVVEAVREGFLLHYRESRLLRAAEPDLALLAGDYLYALGIERLGLLGDAEAVRALADLISLSAQCHAEGRPELGGPLWLAAAVEVGCGAEERLRAAKASILDPGSDAGEAMCRAAAEVAAENGLSGPFGRACESIDSAVARQA